VDGRAGASWLTVWQPDVVVGMVPWWMGPLKKLGMASGDAKLLMASGEETAKLLMASVVGTSVTLRTVVESPGKSGITLMYSHK
jgi:hypothetical protein